MKFAIPRLLAGLIVAAALGAGLAAPGQTTILTNSFIHELISREVAIDVGGAQTPAIKDLVSREVGIFVIDGPGEARAEAISREVSVAVTAGSPPPLVTGFTHSNSPTGDRVALDWSGYNQWAARDVARFDIYVSDQPFTNVTGMTPLKSVPAEGTAVSLSNLPLWQDHFVAIVAVDALGNFGSTVVYTGIYVLSPEAISREVSFFVGAEPAPPYRQAVSREVSIVLATPAAPPAVTSLKTTHSPANDSVTLDWTGYNQWAVGDVARYDIYFSEQAFTNVAGMTPYASVPGETFSITLNGLATWQDHFVAVVAVDAAGNANAAVTYAGIYVVSAEVVSRETSVFIGAEPNRPYREAASREVSMVVADANVPEAVTYLGSGFAAVKSQTNFDAIDLDWSSYNEVAQHDVVRYRIYVATNFFQDVTGMTPFADVSAGTQKATVTGLFSYLTYYVAVVAEDTSGFFNPAVRSISAQASGPNIEFSSQPVGGTVYAGAIVLLTVGVDGPGSIGFQWLMNGSPLAGQTGTNLLFPSAQLGDTGDYALLVTNYFGSVTSSVARLIVLPDTAPPVVAIISPTNHQVFSNAACLLRGSAVDNARVAAVYYRLNGGGWISAPTTNLWQNWEGSVALLPGANLVEAYGVDVNGYVSPTNAVGLAFALGTNTVIPAGFGAEGQFLVHATGIAGYDYVLEGSTNLEDWQPIATNVAPFDYADAEATNFPVRFYRTYIKR